MSVIVLIQCYNEAAYIGRCLANRYPHVDKMVISEGLLSPFGNLSQHSTDNTRSVIKQWIKENDTASKCILLESQELHAKTRESLEGLNKNIMLEAAAPESGDIIHVCDVDEFYDPNGLDWIIQQFKQKDAILTTWVEEYQFAYSTRLAFRSMHGSRFWRYTTGCHFGATNHIYDGNGREFTFDKSFIVPRTTSGVCHLCWTKHPRLIREKVVSFNRRSFTHWFNTRYLRWPGNPDNRGFAEGQREPLAEYKGKLPVEIRDIQDNYLEELKQNWHNYII